MVIEHGAVKERNSVEGSGGDWSSDVYINAKREIILFDPKSSAEGQAVEPPHGQDNTIVIDLSWAVAKCPYHSAIKGPTVLEADQRTLKRVAPTGHGFNAKDTVPVLEPQHFGSTAKTFSVSFKLGKVSAPIHFMLASNAEIIHDQFAEYLEKGMETENGKRFPR